MGTCVEVAMCINVCVCVCDERSGVRVCVIYFTFLIHMNVDECMSMFIYIYIYMYVCAPVWSHICSLECMDTDMVFYMPMLQCNDSTHTGALVPLSCTVYRTSGKINHLK